MKQRTGGTPAAASSLTVPIASGAGNALVATIAVQAGTTTKVTGVTDSAGNPWTIGPVGLLAGSNTRVEIWHSTGAAPVAGVTVNLSAADLASANISEWSGVAPTQAVDAFAGQGNASSTTAATPSIATTNANDLVLGAINFPRAAASTLATTGFTALDNFNASTVSGRAAYRVVSATGSSLARMDTVGSVPERRGRACVEGGTVTEGGAPSRRRPRRRRSSQLVSAAPRPRRTR